MGRNKIGCPAGMEKIYITPYGDVIPCPFIHIGFGNILAARPSLGLAACLGGLCRGRLWFLRDPACEPLATDRPEHGKAGPGLTEEAG